LSGGEPLRGSPTWGSPRRGGTLDWTHLEDYRLIHLLDFMDGQHLIQKCSCHHGTHQLQSDLNQPINCHIRNFNIQHTWRILILMLHIKVFRKTIKDNGEIVEADIINLFGFILWDGISKWGENFVQDHPNCTFEELEQTFCKHFWIVKNDEEVYMQLTNFQQ